MKKLSLTLILSIFSFCLSSVLLAQDDTQTTKNLADLSIGFGKGTFSTAISGFRLHPVALKKKFHLGYGLRYTGFFGSNKEYITAPADVSEGNFLKPQNKAKLDTITFASTQVNSVNLNVHLAYAINPKLLVGFNIDAIGFSVGSPRGGVLQSNGVLSSVQAEVSSFNVLLTGDYDKGSLNSEFYALYALNDKFKLKGGVSFIFTEYTTDKKIASNFDNDQFRNKNLGLMLGVAYSLW